MKSMTLAVGSLALPFVLGAGPRAGVSIKEWDVPTPNSRPHDPAVGPDGALWYTGQMANKLGRLDLRSGQFKEFPLKTPGSGPHGLVADGEGNIWFTAIFKHYIGKLDPRTGTITEYPMPDASADPHTPALDGHGTLWFTTERANFVGRLDTHTGEVRLKEVPTPNAVPYGIVEQAGQHRSPDDGDLRVRHQGTGCATPAAGAGSGRRDLLLRLRPGISGTLRSSLEAVRGMAFTGRRRLEAVRHRRHAGRDRLVQRIGHRPEYARSIRPGHQGAHDHRDPIGRRCGPEHGGGGGRANLPGVQRRQQGRGSRPPRLNPKEASTTRRVGFSVDGRTPR